MLQSILIDNSEHDFYLSVKDKSTFISVKMLFFRNWQWLS